MKAGRIVSGKGDRQYGETEEGGFAGGAKFVAPVHEQECVGHAVWHRAAVKVRGRIPDSWPVCGSSLLIGTVRVCVLHSRGGAAFDLHGRNFVPSQSVVCDDGFSCVVLRGFACYRGELPGVSRELLQQCRCLRLCVA